MPSQEHEAMVEMLKNRPLVESPDINDQRADFDAMLTAFGMPEDVVIEEIQIEAMNADWISTSATDETRVVLYLHGGGYVIGSNVGYRELASRVSRSSCARVLLINYRLAPENMFPAAVDDATLAYRYLLAQGVSADRIVIAGDSAGGGLTLATLMALKQAGDPLPACAVCLSPWADLEGQGESAKPGAVDDPMIRAENLRAMGQLYAGAEVRNPLASPVLGDYEGLPPLLIQVGTREVLLSDAIRVAELAESAGVDVSLEQGEGLIHVWQLFGPDMPESVDALKRIGEFVCSHIS